MIPAYRLRNAVANTNNERMARREWSGRVVEDMEAQTADEGSEFAIYMKAGGIVLSGAAIILAAVFGFLAG